MRNTEAHLSRRELLRWGGGAFLAGVGAQDRAKLTEFQLACMTLPYSAFPFERALKGIAAAGYRYVGWGTTHRNTADGERTPVLALDAPPAEARRLGERTRALGLKPVMMFSQVYVEAADAVAGHRRRIEQAAAAGIPFLLTFGRTRPGEYEAFVRHLKELGPVARAAGVTILIKQHGGNTATGKDCSRILAETADDGIRMCYDAGNVMD